ncbi:MAG: hypothetical protein EOM68_12350, partial [Spirochaetia bacterium]|nr:hypothetical protein [Spirochaetia bacterium]
MTYSIQFITKAITMDTNKLFKEYINPYIKARLDSLPRGKRNQETTEKIYVDAAQAFGVSVDEIRKRQEPPKRVGGSFTKALPWILGGLGAAGLGYAGMDYL